MSDKDKEKIHDTDEPKKQPSTYDGTDPGGGVTEGPGAPEPPPPGGGSTEGPGEPV